MHRPRALDPFERQLDGLATDIDGRLNGSLHVRWSLWSCKLLEACGRALSRLAIQKSPRLAWYHGQGTRGVTDEHRDRRAETDTQQQAMDGIDLQGWLSILAQLGLRWTALACARLGESGQNEPDGDR